MNKWEREITKYQLEDEKRTIAELKAVYSKAREDLKARIEELGVRYDETGLESVIYQKKYQEAIKSQVDSALNQLLSKEYTTIDDFLKDSYNNGFVGNMYLLHQQKIPLAIPIDNKSVVKALQTDSKLSRRYYKGNPLRNRVSENVDLLKTRVRSNLSRGIAQGQSWGDIAVNIASGMSSPMRRALNDSIRIARTEGHRVQQQGFLDAGFEAIKNGADVLKQWDATLDGRTRDEHREVDGTIIKWDEEFDVGGEKMEAPSVGGSARNVCNCRCCLLQRAKWALDEDELETLQERADYFELDKSEQFKTFRKNYLNNVTAENKPNDYSHMIKLNESLGSNKDEFHKLLDNCDNDSIIEIYKTRSEDVSKYKYIKGKGSFNHEWNNITWTIDVSDGNKFSILTHEFGHFMDYNLSSKVKHSYSDKFEDKSATFVDFVFKKVLSSSDEFMGAMKKDKELLESIGFVELEKRLKGDDFSSGVQDFIDGSFVGARNRIYWGHGESYYNMIYDRMEASRKMTGTDHAKEILAVTGMKTKKELKGYCRDVMTAKELWANIASAETCNDKSLDYIKEYAPNSYKAFREIIKGVK
nr:MAG TPA: minor capsid protein [Caudoviricetes sp.]